MISTYTSLNFDLGETNDMLREQVNQFAAAEIAPLAEATDVDNEFPAPLWKKMGDMGLLGITCDEQYGGAGMGYLAHTIAMEEISRASASIGLSYGAHSNLCVNQIHRHGSDEQKTKFVVMYQARSKINKNIHSLRYSHIANVCKYLSSRERCISYIDTRTNVFTRSLPILQYLKVSVRSICPIREIGEI
jgi:hypothetical protein